MVTPGQQEGLKYLTSTPFNAHASPPYGLTSAPYATTSGPYNPVPNELSTPVPAASQHPLTGGGFQVQQHFQPLQTVEETSWETPACAKGESREVQERREENYQVEMPELLILF